MNLHAVSTLTQIAIALTGLSRDSEGVIRELAEASIRTALVEIQLEMKKGIQDDRAEHPS